MNGLGRQPHKDAGTANAESGLVILDGPGGVAVAMTPQAAEQTAHNLKIAADEARRQILHIPAARA